MPKKDDEIIKSLTETLKANTEVIGKVLNLYEVLLNNFQKPTQVISGEKDVATAVDSFIKGITQKPAEEPAPECPDKMEPAEETEEAPPSEPAKQPAQETESETEPVKELTEADCRTVLMELDQKGKNRSQTVELLALFRVKTLPQLKKKEYNDFHQRVVDALAENKTKAKEPEGIV